MFSYLIQHVNIEVTFFKYLININIQGASDIPDECLCTLRSCVFVQYSLFTTHRKINGCGKLLNFQKPRV